MGDLDAARADYTPLQIACIQGNAKTVKLLIDHGADTFALSEGDAPFATVWLGGHDHRCDLLAPLMEEAQKRYPNVWVRARIAQLRREIASLEEKL